MDLSLRTENLIGGAWESADSTIEVLNLMKDLQRELGLTYSRFIDGLAKAGIEVDRKVLSDLAIREPETFKAIVEKARASLPQGEAAAAA